MSLRWVLLSLLALLLAGAGWIYSQLEFEQQSFDIGFSPVAQRFHFLAATRFLEQLGITAEEQSGFSLIDQLDDSDSPVATDHTLVLVDAFAALSEERIQQLLTWVARGGTAFVSTRNFSLREASQLEDTLFNRFGIFVWENELGRDYANEMYTRPQLSGLDESARDIEGLEDLISSLSLLEETQWCPDTFPVVRDTAPDGSETRIQFSGNRFLGFDSGALEGLADSRGYQLVRVPHENGKLIFTTDNQMWSNRRIGCFDHAWQLWNMTTGNHLWFLVNTDSPSLLDMIRAYSPAGFMLALVLIALLVWYHSRRLGLLKTVNNESRRSFKEHLDAAANFSWQARDYRALLNPLREEILEQARKRRPDFASLPAQSKLATLAAFTEMDTGALQQLVFDDIPERMSSSDYEHRVRQMQVILQLI